MVFFRDRFGEDVVEGRAERTGDRGALEGLSGLTVCRLCNGPKPVGVVFPVCGREEGPHEVGDLVPVH